VAASVVAQAESFIEGNAPADVSVVSRPIAISSSVPGMSDFVSWSTDSLHPAAFLKSFILVFFIRFKMVFEHNGSRRR
jgi:hypothetical protein